MNLSHSTPSPFFLTFFPTYSHTPDITRGKKIIKQLLRVKLNITGPKQIDVKKKQTKNKQTNKQTNKKQVTTINIKTKLRDINI